MRTETSPQLTSPATRVAYGADYEHVLTRQARRRRLDTAIEEMAAASEFTGRPPDVLSARGEHPDRFRVCSAKLSHTIAMRTSAG
ncbi:hypothetical protein RHRU231_230059 [Rhodococcus ruber]|uniref:Uncharacterized protein n=1 Tax=Rhodococcus ruber TaxID=1830 RepID=A0A098BHM9_9NOCA|nr:hypothetical protein RHRU231_230059 [Rhodococcus ruber]